MNKIELISHSNNTEDWSYEVIMEKCGKAFVRIYWYHDDKDSIYIDSLSVNEQERKKGIGKFLLHTCEKIAREKNAHMIYLIVEKNSWMRYWYEREDYRPYLNVTSLDSRMIWMEKFLFKKEK